MESTLDLRLPSEAEALEFFSLNFFGDGVAREKGNSKAFAGGSLDRFARVELPQPLGLDTRSAKSLLGHLACA